MFSNVLYTELKQRIQECHDMCDWDSAVFYGRIALESMMNDNCTPLIVEGVHDLGYSLYANGLYYQSINVVLNQQSKSLDDISGCLLAQSLVSKLAYSISLRKSLRCSFFFRFIMLTLC